MLAQNLNQGLGTRRDRRRISLPVFWLTVVALDVKYDTAASRLASVVGFVVRFLFEIPDN